MNRCTFLAFGDLHHYPGVFYPDKEERWEKILARSIEENADFIVGLGDYVHEPAVNGALAERMLASTKDLILCLGNHDTEHAPMEEVLPLYGMPHNYYFVDRGGYRFILLDANYTINDGEYVHYNPGVENRTKRGVIPPDQLAWLEQTIAASSTPCVLLSHHSIERPDGMLNKDRVWEIIHRANQHRPHAVVLYINGHYHRDYCTIVNGVCCLELNSASYQWVNPPFGGYPAEVLAHGRAMAYTLNFSQPLSALITLEGATRITIRGVTGEYMFGLTAADVESVDGQHRLSYARRSVPFIRDYTVDLDCGTVTRSRE
ncbi:MAG: metallophosphoesterase [Clostridia bacterium]|nr:metallophosphoesterase [Clostridia bacterium]